jgi:hypothetical protein
MQSAAAALAQRELATINFILGFPFDSQRWRPVIRASGL